LTYCAIWHSSAWIF
nr:immunoglobulin light chain junction region [Macaca mulatta]